MRHRRTWTDRSQSDKERLMIEAMPIVFLSWPLGPRIGVTRPKTKTKRGWYQDERWSKVVRNKSSSAAPAPKASKIDNVVKHEAYFPRGAPAAAVVPLWRDREKGRTLKYLNNGDRLWYLRMITTMEVQVGRSTEETIMTAYMDGDTESRRSSTVLGRSCHRHWCLVSQVSHNIR